MNIAQPSFFHEPNRVKSNPGTTLSYKNALISAQHKSFAAKQAVFHEGDAKHTVYQVETGAVRLFKIKADGRRQIFGFALPGDIIGLGGSESHSLSAQAVSSTVLKTLPIARLYQFALQDPTFALSLYQAMSLELEATRDLLLSLGQHNTLERLALFLLSLSERNARLGKNPHMLTLPIKRLDIADFLNMTIETVSRSFTKLRERNLIALLKGGRLEIIDREGLQSLCEETTYH